MEASRSLGFLGSLPIEIFCPIVRRLDSRGLQNLLQVYSQYREQILGCLTQFPVPGREEEILPFLQSLPEVSLPFPPSFFGTTEKGPEIQVPDRPTLQFLSRRVRGDLSVRWEGRGRWEEWEERMGRMFEALLDFFFVRSTLYSQSLTGIHISFDEATEAVTPEREPVKGSAVMRYRDETLTLTTRGMFRLQNKIMDVIERLPIRDVMVSLDNLFEPEEVEALASVLAPKEIETYRVSGGMAPIRVLDAIFLRRSEEGSSFSIRTLLFVGYGDYVSLYYGYSILQRYPGIQNLHGVSFIEDNDWRKSLRLFPDLRSLSYYPNQLIREEEIQETYPSLQIIRLEPIEHPPILRFAPLQLFHSTRL